MNKKLIIIAGVVLLALGVFVSYYTFNRQIDIVELRDSPLSIYLENEMETFSESTDWYEVKIEYPKNNQKVRDQVIKMWEDFAKENQLKTFNTFEEAKEGLQINVEGLKYSFNADYKLVAGNKTLTYVYQIYSFTGGAHGATLIYPISFNESLTILPVENILPTDQLEKISALAYVDLTKQKAERLKSFSMTESEVKEAMKDTSWLQEGTAPTRENYSSVWNDGEYIIISFGQYQIGPYAEGIYEVKIPRSALQ